MCIKAPGCHNQGRITNPSDVPLKLQIKRAVQKQPHLAESKSYLHNSAMNLWNTTDVEVQQENEDFICHLWSDSLPLFCQREIFI